MWRGHRKYQTIGALFVLLACAGFVMLVLGAPSPGITTNWWLVIGGILTIAAGWMGLIVTLDRFERYYPDEYRGRRRRY